MRKLLTLLAAMIGLALALECFGLFKVAIPLLEPLPLLGCEHRCLRRAASRFSGNRRSGKQEHQETRRQAAKLCLQSFAEQGQDLARISIAARGRSKRAGNCEHEDEVENGGEHLAPGRNALVNFRLGGSRIGHDSTCKNHDYMRLWVRYLSAEGFTLTFSLMGFHSPSDWTKSSS